MPITIQGTPWHKELQVLLSGTKHSAFVCLTHVIQPTVDLLLQNLQPGVKLRVLTRLDKVFLDAESLKRLIERPLCEVRILKNQASKLYILDGKTAILAGSNLTLDGLERSLAFDVVIEDRRALVELLARLEKYWKEAEVLKDASRTLLDKRHVFGSSADPIPADPIEFRSYEDVLIERLAVKLAKDPDDTVSLCRLGDLLRFQCDREGAVEAYRKALRLAPDMSEPRIGLAKCFWEQGDPEHCLDEVFEVLKRDKENAEAYYLSSVVYKHRGEESLAQAARREYERLSGKK
jgi:tetratricopeptide (TPR) repeat protein